MARNILIRFTDAQAKALEQYKAKTGCNLNEAVRRAVEDRYVSPTGYERLLLDEALDSGKAVA
jgi:hypothetical protein